MQTNGLFDLQLMMFLLMGIGFFLRKRGILTPAGKAALTDLIIDLILPCNIIHSFCVEFNHDILVSGLQIFVVSLVLQLFCAVLASTCYRRVPKHQRMVLQYGTVCSNAGFLGNPVAEGLYGPMGLLYASIYLIPQRIVMWSAGVSYFTESPDRKSVLKKVITHPCIVAVFVGVVLMLTQVQLPVFLDKAITSLGGCTTALTMLFIGAVLAEAGGSQLLSRITMIFSAIRLIGIPAVVLAGCLLCRVDPLVTRVSVVLAAMPAGTTTAILAAKYHGDEAFATGSVVVTTVLSMALLPAWCWVLEYLVPFAM